MEYVSPQSLRLSPGLIGSWQKEYAATSYGMLKAGTSVRCSWCHVWRLNPLGKVQVHVESIGFSVTNTLPCSNCHLTHAPRHAPRHAPLPYLAP